MNEKKLTSEELVEYIQITINNGGPYALLEELNISNRDEIFAKIKSSLNAYPNHRIDEVIMPEPTKEFGAPDEIFSNPISAVQTPIPIDSASIYAKEHLQDVQEDLTTHDNIIYQEEETKLNQPKVLERKLPPVNFVGCEIVAPGQFNK